MLTTGEHVCEWVAPRAGGAYYRGSGQGLGWLKNGELIAGVLFDNCNGRSVQMHVAAVPGKRWMTREFLRVCFDYPFNQLKVNKIVGLVDSTNLEALAFDKNLGFETEYVMQGAGKVGDLHILTMTRQQCRFLGE